MGFCRIHYRPSWILVSDYGEKIMNEVLIKDINKNLCTLLQQVDTLYWRRSSAKSISAIDQERQYLDEAISKLHETQSLLAKYVHG